MFRNCGCSSNNQFTSDDYDDNDNNSDIYEESCAMMNNSFPNNGSMCSCGFNQGVSMFPKRIMYGHSYVPNQIMNRIFTPEMGLKMGTIYPELVSPYTPGQSMEVNNFLAKCNDVGEGCNSNE